MEKNINFLENNKGFTLVELAIVLVIIGFLVSGIIAGQELINQAKINKAISKLNSYKGVLTKYG
jgi:prepilin-type N-terminal cleavage/methylation domain-containing protein